MPTLICGSVAYDTIMVFQDRFKNHILPDQIHILNVSFLVPAMRRDFGGCAGNIAYNLKLLGGDPLIMATVGDDATSYLEHLERFGISQQHIRHIKGTFTAQAFITTDLDDNQITAFHPGAMSFSHQNHVADTRGVSLAIVSPDGRDGMIKHANDLVDAKIPFIFDLGQALPIFSGEDLLQFMEKASYACFNDYEVKVTCDRTACSVEELAEKVSALVVTHGAEGSHIYANGEVHQIPSVKAEREIDPTGCGDAYRAGLLYGIDHKWDWAKTGRLASLMGAIKVAERGCQNHAPLREEIADRYYRAFSEKLWG